mmetsp:Transcript_35454/g.34487  ORF Transcript_35454/g.34487 Transcript_35454/m.34487 type:complete len:477 (-) Transcript_35454:595-2025(-)
MDAVQEAWGSVVNQDREPAAPPWVDPQLLLVRLGVEGLVIVCVVPFELILVSESAFGERVVVDDVRDQFPLIAEKGHVPINELDLHGAHGVLDDAALGVVDALLELLEGFRIHDPLDVVGVLAHLIQLLGLGGCGLLIQERIVLVVPELDVLDVMLLLVLLGELLVQELLSFLLRHNLHRQLHELRVVLVRKQLQTVVVVFRVTILILFLSIDCFHPGVREVVEAGVMGVRLLLHDVQVVLKVPVHILLLLPILHLALLLRLIIFLFSRSEDSAFLLGGGFIHESPPHEDVDIVLFEEPLIHILVVFILHDDGVVFLEAPLLAFLGGGDQVLHLLLGGIEDGVVGAAALIEGANIQAGVCLLAPLFLGLFLLLLILVPLHELEHVFKLQERLGHTVFAHFQHTLLLLVASNVVARVCLQLLVEQLDRLELGQVILQLLLFGGNLIDIHFFLDLWNQLWHWRLGRLLFFWLDLDGLV